MVICIVTIHGIGFQTAPDDATGQPGYADGLHRNLRTHLDTTLLGDDPNRPNGGPVYVQSHWPPDSHQSEPGLSRLGTWKPLPASEIDITGASLVAGDAPLAHVALVYAHMQDQGPNLPSLLEATASAAFQHAHYSSVLGTAHLLMQDAWALVDRGTGGGPDPSGLQVRTDQPNPPTDPMGVFATVKQLEADVTTYVCRDDLRERLRRFVREAIVRLAYRADVDGIIINAHSQGTVLCFDVLRAMPPAVAAKLNAFITAGSPLRKYVDLFSWGSEVENLATLPGDKWVNFYDSEDPVADPLRPPSGWQPGDDRAFAADAPSLFAVLDAETGAVTSVIVDDRKVDNVTNSQGGGLRAHNYWDNDTEVVQPLVALLRQMI
jgi:hypothetical protein